MKKSDSRPSTFRGAGYYGQIEINPFIEPGTDGFRRKHLASFVGARTDPIRSTLFGALKDAPDFLLRDTTGRQSWTLTHEEKLTYQKSYAEEVKASAFILCPRGLGPSSYRLFEAMKAGRCPVIVADEWTAPEGPDWTSCSLQIPESQVSEIPHILLRERDRAQALGANARSVWEAWFSPERAFEVVTRQCLEMKAAGSSGRFRWHKCLSRPAFRHALRGLRRQAPQLPRMLTAWLKA